MSDPSPPSPPTNSAPPNDLDPKPPSPSASYPPRRSGRKGKQTEKYTGGSSNLELAETEGDLEALDKAYVKSVELYIAASSPNEPQTYQQAIDSPEADQWNAAMLDEYKS